jgi:hypothetical protein
MAMKKKILELIIYPGLAILFCLAFGVPFVYAGFQQVVVEGNKDQDQSATLIVNRSHYFGLIQQDFQISDVEQASWVNSRVRRVGKPRRLLSGVYLISTTEEQALFFGSSNVDEDLKRQAITEINDFIADPESQDFSAVYRIRNIFGWFGLPFLVLGVWGILAWPVSILKGVDE